MFKGGGRSRPCPPPFLGLVQYSRVSWLGALAHRLVLARKILAESRQRWCRNCVLFINGQERKNAWAFEVSREISRPGDDMDVNVVKAFTLSETHQIFFLDRTIGVHYLDIYD